MEGLITFLKTNWVSLSAIITGLVTVASIIVKLTPTPKDDAVMAKIIKALQVLSIGTKHKNQT